MRIRRKPWAAAELAACPFYTEHPEEYQGRWREWFGNGKPIFMELGCGKGGFISQQAVQDPSHNYIAVDLIDAMLGLAKRNVERAYEQAGREPDNVRLVTHNIERLHLMLEEGVDKIDRIYINFCNPWSHHSQRKKRLTHSRQLTSYRKFLTDDAQIWFKTDDDSLFADTLVYLEECGFAVEYSTFDLHASDFTESLPTEHEKMFSEQGILIKFLIARMLPLKSAASELGGDTTQSAE